GPGFRSTTRIAATPANIMLDVMETNQENIVAHLDRFKKQLDNFEALLSSGEYAALNLSLNESAEKQRNMTANPGRREIL
ncbi:MAG: prephenate dehydrogenase/arogenate dehydrogenase family protein, partial [Anaerolineales bacterium]|nr:prephenate dehydrogenase/arogenate dehydrogenase family protein [Anaerolineales bacterium]